MKVLVTGAGGFLGGEIARLLVSEGHEVVNLSRNHYVELDTYQIPTLKCDLANKEFVDLTGFEAVIHCAAVAGVWGKKASFYDTNYHGALHLFDMAKKAGVKYFVYTSTPSVVFGKEDIIWGDEKLPYPDRFYTYYAHSKALAEKYILENSDHEMESVAIRPHLIWGKGDPHIIPRLVKKARKGELKRVGNGDNLVDVIHVKNAAIAHVQSLMALKNGKGLGGNAYFIGQERPVNLWEFINQILHYNDIDPIVDSVSFKMAFFIGGFLEFVFKLFGINKPEPPMTRFVAMQLAKNHYFAHDKAHKDFGYEPKLTIEEALEDTFRGEEYKIKMQNTLNDLKT
jgi:nucleoside-diphosphate-sugar epimerase